MGRKREETGCLALFIKRHPLKTFKCPILIKESIEKSEKLLQKLIIYVDGRKTEEGRAELYQDGTEMWESRKKT